MPIQIKKFDPASAEKGHEGTILSSDVLPAGMTAPFQHAYGYLENNQTMAGHRHDTDEIYIVFSGTGSVILGGENKAVGQGDVIAIPANVWHTMTCSDKDQSPFLWAALWWDHIEK